MSGSFITRQNKKQEGSEAEKCFEHNNASLLIIFDRFSAGTSLFKDLITDLYSKEMFYLTLSVSNNPNKFFFFFFLISEGRMFLQTGMF